MNSPFGSFARVASFLRDPLGVFNHIVTEEAACPTCGGSGQKDLTDPDGTVWDTIKCPECKGSGRIIQFGKESVIYE